MRILVIGAGGVGSAFVPRRQPRLVLVRHEYGSPWGMREGRSG